MRAPYTQLFLHVVWSTWDRAPLLVGALQQAVYACIQAEVAALRAEVLALGGMADHVHLLVRFPTTLSVAELVKQVKGSSSHLATHQVPGGETFKWQGAYGAFTVSRRDVRRVKEYIRRQEEHHSQPDGLWDCETCEWIEEADLAE